jgi:hypothetical protein
VLTCLLARFSSSEHAPSTRNCCLALCTRTAPDMDLLAFISTLNWPSYAHPWSMLRRMRKDTYEFMDHVELGRVTKKRSMIIERDVKLQDKERAIKYKCIKASEVEPKAKHRRCRPSLNIAASIPNVPAPPLPSAAERRRGLRKASGWNRGRVG